MKPKLIWSDGEHVPIIDYYSTRKFVVIAAELAFVAVNKLDIVAVVVVAINWASLGYQLQFVVLNQAITVLYYSSIEKNS